MVIPIYLCQPAEKLFVGAKNISTVYTNPKGAKYATIDLSILRKGLMNNVTTNATRAYPNKA